MATAEKPAAASKGAVGMDLCARHLLGWVLLGPNKRLTSSSDTRRLRHVLGHERGE